MKEYKNIFKPQKSAFHTDIFSVVSKINIVESTVENLEGGVLLSGTPLNTQIGGVNPITSPINGVYVISDTPQLATHPMAILASDLDISELEFIGGEAEVSVGVHVIAVVYMQAIRDAFEALGFGPTGPFDSPFSNGLTIYNPNVSRA